MATLAVAMFVTLNGQLPKENAKNLGRFGMLTLRVKHGTQNNFWNL